MSGNCFRFNSGVLTTKLPMRNPSGLKLAWAQCENEEAQLDWPDQPLLERIRNALEPGPGGYPGLEEISRRMGLSPRTLRRHLEADHSSFATLLETRKHQDAIRLLNDPELSIQDISTRLGYLDPANFTRAFRQWTGENTHTVSSKRQIPPLRSMLGPVGEQQIRGMVGATLSTGFIGALPQTGCHRKRPLLAECMR
jgi:AraC-like DNA-binding protein